QVPEVGQALDLLFGHQDQNLRERRLPLEDRLRRAATIVLPLELHQGVEVQVLILQRVHEFVRDHEAGLTGIDVGRNVERIRVGVEVPGDLLGEEIDHGAAQVERVGDESRSEEHTSELQSRVDLVCRL